MSNEDNKIAHDDNMKDESFESSNEEQFYDSWEEYFLDSCRFGYFDKRPGGSRALLEKQMRCFCERQVSQQCLPFS